MADYQHFTSFVLEDPVTGKIQSLENDFDGVIINTNNSWYERECSPDFEDLTDKCDTRDGELFINSYEKPREISMTIFFKNTDGDLTRLKQWLCKKYEQIFMWEDDDENKYIKVKLKEGFSSQVYYGKHFNGRFDLKFIAYDPYYRIKSERQLEFKDIQINKEYNVRSRGNVDCYPTLYITPQTNNINIKWNDLDIKLKDLIIGKEYIMDCENERFYYIDENGEKVYCVGSNYESDRLIHFPVMRSELKNTFILTSGYGKIKMDINSRIL